MINTLCSPACWWPPEKGQHIRRSEASSDLAQTVLCFPSHSAIFPQRQWSLTTWVLGCHNRSTFEVVYLVSRGVICRKPPSAPQQQKLADLPEDRVQPAAPLAYCGVDYFGPFTVKEGRKEVKRYGVIFKCMASRAIHIETANTLETDAFINALRRFQAERGPAFNCEILTFSTFLWGKNKLALATFCCCCIFFTRPKPRWNQTSPAPVIVP